MIRVLVAEDSTTARLLLVEMLGSDPEIQVVGQARDGREAVVLTRQLRPDVVSMDIQMPTMDGFEATTRIMQETPTPIVIVSSLDVKDVRISLESLRAGALALLPKPVGPRSPQYAEEKQAFLITLKAMSQVKLFRRPRTQPPFAGLAPVARPVSTHGYANTGVRVVGLVASTGGPAALLRILSALPGDLPVPILAVQHIALGFAPGLAEWLAASCKVKVRMAVHGEPLLPGTVYMPPDNHHLGVMEGMHVLVSQESPVGGFRPSGTFLFQSMARVAGASCMGVILTGMGTDGVEGLRAIRAAGGRILAQDEASSEVWGMPGAAVAAGLHDAVVPLTDVALQIQRAVGIPA